MANQSTLQVLIDIRSKLEGLTESVTQMRQLRAETEATAKAGQGGFANLFKIGESIDLVRRLNDVAAEVPRRIFEWTREGVLFNAELETTRRGVAAQLEQFQPEKFRSFTDAIGAAGGVVDLLREKAKQFGLEYTSVFEQYQTTVGALIAGGVRETQKQIDLTILLGNTMRAIGIQGFQAARDTTDLLNGLAERTIAGRILQIKDEDIQRAKEAGTLYQFLTDKLKGYRDAGVQASQGFNASIGRLHDNIKDLQEVTTAGLFEGLKGQINDLNSFLADARTRENARGWSEFVQLQFKRIADGAKSLVDDVKAIDQALVIPAKIFDLEKSFVSPFVTGGEEGARDQFVQEAQQRRAALLVEIDTATTLNAKIKALRDLELERINLTERLNDKNELTRNAASQLLGLVTELIAQYPALVGRAQDHANAWKTTADEAERAIKAAQSLQGVQIQTKIKQAEATGDKSAVIGLQADQTRDDAFRKLFAAGVEPVAAARAAEELASATRDAAQHQLDISNETKATAAAHRDITAVIRQEETTLQGIRQQQQLINQAPFLSVDEKNAQLLTLMREEIGTLNDEVKKGQALLDGGTLDAATYEQVAQKVQQARFEIELLTQKTQTLSFSGGLRENLTSWVNGFGTAAQQVGRAITGSINTALDATADILTGLIFQTGNWRQRALQAEQQIVGSLIKIGGQMLFNATLGKLLTRQNAADQSAAGAQIAASNAPAAAATSIASFGSSAVVGAIAAAAAIAAIIALLVGFEGGGYTGDKGTRQIAGVVHGKEFVHDDPTVRRYGLPVMEAMRRGVIPPERIQELLGNYRYAVTPRLGSFEVGGAVAALEASSNDRAAAGSGSAPLVIKGFKTVVINDVAKLRKEIFDSDEAVVFVVDAITGNAHLVKGAIASS